MPASFYSTDLAYVHHVGFGDFASQAAPGLLAELRAARLPSRVVVDLGCGSGIWLSRAARAGYQTIGVDLSPAMVRLARANSPSSKLVCASLRDFPLPPCGAVTALGEALCYFPPNLRPYSLAPVFRRVANALEEDGLFIFDLLTTSARRSMNAQICTTGRDWAVLTERIEKVGVITRNITVFRKIGRTYRRSFETHCAAVYSVEQVRKELRRAGFSVVTKKRYGKFKLLPRRTAFFARRLAG